MSLGCDGKIGVLECEILEPEVLDEFSRLGVTLQDD